MCRAGSRRCPGAGGRSTQNTRQAVSRAKSALARAKETGDPDQVTAARERLSVAKTTHQLAKTLAAATEIARHHGDVTGEQPTTTKDNPTMDDQQQPRGEQHQGEEHQRDDHEPRTSFTLHNTNIATGNATVGSQHDIHHGDYSSDQQNADKPLAWHVAHARERAQRAHDRAQRHADQPGRGTNTNTAGRDEYVSQQVGWNFGAGHDGDVTDQRRTHTTTHHTPHGTVTNTVHGDNHGVQTDVVHGPLYFGGPPPRAGHDRDVTPPTTTDPQSTGQGVQVFHTPGGTTRVDPDGYVESTRDGHTRFQGRVSGQVWVNGKRVR